MLSRMKFRINVYDMSNVDSAPSNKFRMIIPPVIIDYKKDMVENIMKRIIEQMKKIQRK